MFTVSVSTESGRLRQNSQHSVRTCRGFNEQGAAAAQPHAPFRVWGPCWGLPPAGRPVGGRAVLAVGPSSPHGWAWRAHPDAAARSPLGEQGEAAPSGVGGPPRPRGYEEEGPQDEGDTPRPLPEAPPLPSAPPPPSPLLPLHCLQLSDSRASESREGVVLPGAQALRWMLPCSGCAGNGRARPPRGAALISPAEARSSSS